MRRRSLALFSRANRAEQCRLSGVIKPADICSLRVLRILTPTRTLARGTRTGLPPIGGYNVVAIATLIQNNSGRPIRLAGHSMAG